MQHARLVELETKHVLSRLTVAEAMEIFALREREAKRRSHRAWRMRGDNLSRCVELTRKWRQANPGMG